MTSLAGQLFGRTGNSDLAEGNSCAPCDSGGSVARRSWRRPMCRIRWRGRARLWSRGRPPVAISATSSRSRGGTPTGRTPPPRPPPPAAPPPPHAPPPRIPGREVVGRTAAGRRVLGYVPQGGYATKTVVADRHLVALPPGVGAGEALAVLLQGLTAWHLL